MAFLDELGLQTLWNNTKAWFAKYLDKETAESSVTIKLKSGQKAKADASVLDSIAIDAATTKVAGVMSAADKTKLDGIVKGATANAGTITGITTSSPLAGSGTSGSVALSHSTSGVTAGTYGKTATTALTPGFGSTFDVPGITVNSTGHVTAAGSHTVKIPSTVATVSAAGLMSTTDKTKLDGLATVATSGSYNDLINKPTIPAAYTLPTASADTLGGVKVGTNLSIADGVLGAANDKVDVTGNLVKTIAFTGISYTGIKDNLIGEYNTELLVNTMMVARYGELWIGYGLDNIMYTKGDSWQFQTKGSDGTYSTTSSINATQYTGNAATATTATRLATDDVGSALQPIYFSDGVPVAGGFTFTNNLDSSTPPGDVPTGSAVRHYVSATALLPTDKGAANGVAELDSSGKVPAAQLPSYVDDVLEYSAYASFPATGETGKIYVDTATNKTYRWSGTTYVEISASLALGETSSTAYRGDRGATAYTHATADKPTALSKGLYTITTSARGHVISGTAVSGADLYNMILSDSTLVGAPIYMLVGKLNSGSDESYLSVEWAFPERSDPSNLRDSLPGTTYLVYMEDEGSFTGQYLFALTSDTGEYFPTDQNLCFQGNLISSANPVAWAAGAILVIVHIYAGTTGWDIVAIINQNESISDAEITSICQ